MQLQVHHNVVVLGIKVDGSLGRELVHEEEVVDTASVLGREDTHNEQVGVGGHRPDVVRDERDVDPQGVAREVVPHDHAAVQVLDGPGGSLCQTHIQRPFNLGLGEDVGDQKGGAAKHGDRAVQIPNGQLVDLNRLRPQERHLKLLGELQGLHKVRSLVQEVVVLHRVDEALHELAGLLGQEGEEDIRGARVYLDLRVYTRCLLLEDLLHATLHLLSQEKQSHVPDSRQVYWVRGAPSINDHSEILVLSLKWLHEIHQKQPVLELSLGNLNSAVQAGIHISRRLVVWTACNGIQLYKAEVSTCRSTNHLRILAGSVVIGHEKQ
ncbi:hypothetical protein OJ253_3246 [Cryptosporidium canis]|uniref:Uncharacterized protein n=1 Tax=Cryptosporidium canis TaxID=195482 RepID=A0A9D5DHT3_9CRYT|nr:hypothetical protein OJ253_3246 [Cryptosporidium canis]